MPSLSRAKLPACPDGSGVDVGSPNRRLQFQTAPGHRYHGEHPSRSAWPLPMAQDPRTRETSTHPEPLSSEDTIDLLERVRGGDNEALEALLARCLPPLRRFAHSRLPSSARGMQDTEDLVQDSVVKALRRLDNFDARHQGALQAYLRQIVMNQIRDIIRQRNRRPDQTDVPDSLADDRESPLDQAIGSEHVEIYERALARMRPIDREAIVNRLELQYSYEELAVALDKPTASAARVAVMRAMKRLVEEMRHAG